MSTGLCTYDSKWFYVLPLDQIKLRLSNFPLRNNLFKSTILIILNLFLTLYLIERKL